MTAAKPTVEPTDRLAVVGLGSELRGDDAAGLALVRRLSPADGGAGSNRPAPADGDRLLTVEGGVAPENYTGVVRRFDPDWVVLVDAVDFGGDPGTGKWVDPDDLGGESFSSHKSTPAMLTTFLARETGAEVALFGVQPASVGLGEDLSPAVASRLDDLAAALADALGVDA
ncbi:MAG: hydrogenase maturation protease [Haloarculaceae archaeon]